jgi:hypothetical protein
MRIAVRVTVEMTPEQLDNYCSYNGIGRREVRQDVTDYIRTALQDAPCFTEDMADVSVS